MTTFYVDSSALVKRYVTENGSGWAQAFCATEAGHVIALAQIGLVEIAAALAAKQRQGVLSPMVAEGLLRDLEHDSHMQYFLIAIGPAIVKEAIALTSRRKLRGYDAVHLSCALFLRDTLQQRQLPAPIFISADLDLLNAAQAEGMAVDNPNTYP